MGNKSGAEHRGNCSIFFQHKLSCHSSYLLSVGNQAELGCRNFASKDDLIVNYLEYRGDLTLERLEEAERLYPVSPQMELFPLLDGLVERISQSDFRGCPFMNTVVKFPDANHPAHQKAVKCTKPYLSSGSDEVGGSIPLGSIYRVKNEHTLPLEMFFKNSMVQSTRK